MKTEINNAVETRDNESIILNPYKGINFYGKEILFGMSQKDVRKITGEKPTKIEIDNIMEEIREFRSGMIFTYIDKKMIDVTFTLNTDLIIYTIEVFKCNNLIEELSKFDSPTTEGKNAYINFYNLGISVGGFGKRKIPEKKLVSAFAKERIKFYEFFLKV